MSKFQYRYIEAHKVNLVHQIDIDTKDQALWEKLLNLVDPDLLEEGNEFPKKAPSNPDDWFKLLSLINQEEFESHEDWWTYRQGNYEIFRELLDKDGKVVIST